MITHLALDGVAESSLGVGIDVVGSASRLVDGGLVSTPKRSSALRQRVVSVDGRPVRSGAGRQIAVDGALSLRALGPADVVVVPGIFAATERSIARALARADVARCGEILARGAARGALVAASCSATFVLAAAGLLDGQPATTTWWLAPEFARRFPSVVLESDRMVVEADHVLTAGSAFAHADLMLAVVARIASSSLAQLVARYLVIDDRPSQSRYMVLEHLRVRDPAVQAVEKFASDHVDRQISVEELARAVAVSPRTLARRIHATLGMTPHELVQRVRVRHAANLLETTHASVEEVAARVGYADAAAFRRVFRRYAGESPRGRRARAASPNARA
ncbi:MAG: helix-turn-helix domain-containing protein [Deltaproteobacteria bacterium]|nr:helix-turn-helix domain-containing protein [Deltaproteobacteria bacterium]